MECLAGAKHCPFSHKGYRSRQILLNKWFSRERVLGLGLGGEREPDM